MKQILKESVYITLLSNIINSIDEPINVIAQDDAANAKWWPLDELPTLAFDHDEIMKKAIGLYRSLTK